MRGAKERGDTVKVTCRVLDGAAADLLTLHRKGVGGSARVRHCVLMSIVGSLWGLLLSRAGAAIAAVLG